MAKLIASMARRKGNFWVENETKKLLQPQRYAAKKTPEARTRKWGKGEGKDEAKKASEERKKKKKKKAQEAEARGEATTEAKKEEEQGKGEEESEEGEAKEGKGKGKGKGDGGGEGEGEGEGKEGEVGQGKQDVQWHDALWPLDILEGAGSETEGDSWAACLPRNAEEEQPASRTGRAEAEAVGTAAAVGAVKAQVAAVSAAAQRAQDEKMKEWMTKKEEINDC
jgi:hypothetical protein